MKDSGPKKSFLRAGVLIFSDFVNMSPKFSGIFLKPNSENTFSSYICPNDISPGNSQFRQLDAFEQVV